MAGDLAFPYRNARSPAIMSAIAAVIVIESVAVHFAVAARHPGVAWALTLTSISALVWLLRDYLNLTKPAAPNVLIMLATPQRVRLVAGIHREVRRLALRLDDPDSFLRALDEHRAALAAHSAEWTHVMRRG